MSRTATLSMKTQPLRSSPPTTAGATTWDTQQVAALSSRALPEMKYKEKDSPTSFFVKSIFAGGIAGCAVSIPPLPHPHPPFTAITYPFISRPVFDISGSSTWGVTS